MEKNKALLVTVRKRMAAAVDWDRTNREEGMDDLQNSIGRQWPDEIKQAREADGRPCITVNRLPQFIRQVTGDIRKLNPAIKVLPSDSEATEDGKDIIEGLIRQIEYSSDASSVYEGAAEQAASCGIGNFRVRADYESEMSFSQCLKIEAIPNPFSVYWDPKARLPTRADARYCFITESMSKEDFKANFPGKDAMDVDHDGETDGLEHWGHDGNVVIAEYIWLSPKKVKIGLLRDGSVVENPKPPMDFIEERETVVNSLKWAKVSGNDVLEGPTELPGKLMPVIAVTGEEVHVGDEVYRSSVIRHAKDPQRLYNYNSSIQAETVGLQPKAPFMVTPKQVAGLESFWNKANTENRPYLPYNPDEKAPAPQRVAPAVSSQGVSQEILKAADDMKATTGIYDASLGGRSNEQSGVAIRQRQLEGDISTSIYADNLQKSIAQCGRVLLGQIPVVYDTKRDILVMGLDDSSEVKTINRPTWGLDEMQTPVRTTENDLTRGKYEIRVGVGPSYSTRRQEASEGLLEFVKAIPGTAEIAGDLIARNLDFPGAEELADRMEKVMPVQLQNQDSMDPQQMAQMQAQAQQQAAMQQAMAEAEVRKQIAEASEAEADAQKASYEMEQERIAAMLQSGQLDAVIEAAAQRLAMNMVRPL